MLEFGEPEGLLQVLESGGTAGGFTDRGQIVSGGDNDVDVRAFLQDARGKFERDSVGQFVIENDVANIVFVQRPNGVGLGEIGGEMLFLEAKREKSGVQVEQERLAIFDHQNCVVWRGKIRGRTIDIMFQHLVHKLSGLTSNLVSISRAIRNQALPELTHELFTIGCETACGCSN